MGAAGSAAGGTWRCCRAPLWPPLTASRPACHPPTRPRRAGEGEGDLGAHTPTSARSAAGGHGFAGLGGLGGGQGMGSPQNIGAWLDRTQSLFSSVEHILGQDLGGERDRTGLANGINTWMCCSPWAPPALHW